MGKNYLPNKAIKLAGIIIGNARAGIIKLNVSGINAVKKN